MTTATINITPDGIEVADGPLVGGERIPVAVSGLDLADGAALSLVMRAQSPAAPLATVALKHGDGGAWTGTLDTATRLAAVFFATAAADEARTVVLELLDTATRDSLFILAAPLRNSALLPSLAPCAVEPVYLGTPGPQGDAATVVVDSVSTLPAGSEATVENVGTENAARLAFGIPRGENPLALENKINPQECLAYAAQGLVTPVIGLFATISVSAYPNITRVTNSATGSVGRYGILRIANDTQGEIVFDGYTVPRLHNYVLFFTKLASTGAAVAISKGVFQ